jgi:AcrR family transcriptional regulator
MDRRQQKTRVAIFKAFSTLLETKRYSNITVQAIIDEANIGRSTFYGHFDTKDELLKVMCTDIFSHVFSDELMSEKTHDFSGGNQGLEVKLTHILHHLQDSGALFMGHFKEYLTEMFSKYLKGIKVNAPTDFVLNHFVGSFAETVKWWIDNSMKYTPEETANYYIEVSCVNRIIDI